MNMRERHFPSLQPSSFSLIHRGSMRGMVIFSHKKVRKQEIASFPSLQRHGTFMVVLAKARRA